MKNLEYQNSVFKLWAAFNNMKPTKTAMRIWLKEEQVREFLKLILEKLEPLEQWRIQS